MWIASSLGFYSIVKKEDARGGPLWHVRGRVREDLVNLKRAARLGGRGAVHESPEADYRYRLVVGRVGIAKVALALALSVRYPNFKGEVGKRPDQRPKLPIYHRWWSDMLALQPGGAYGGAYFFGRGPTLFPDELEYGDHGYDENLIPESESACRRCGCSDVDACVDESTGQPCGWAEPDLCTFCAAQASDAREPAEDPR
jgi:hypothetical protein